MLPTIVTPRPAPAPVAVLPAPASEASAGRLVAIDVARMDPSGRLRATRVLRALDWLPGMGIDVDVVREAIVIRAGSSGRHRIGRLGDIRVPASIRILSGIGDCRSVFVAALVHRQLLVIHPAGTIARVLGRTYDRLIGKLDAR